MADNKKKTAGDILKQIEKENRESKKDAERLKEIKKKQQEKKTK